MVEVYVAAAGARPALPECAYPRGRHSTARTSKLNCLKTDTYEISLPTGGSLVYHYDRGKCVLIESVGNIQSMTMKLKTK